MSKHEDINYWGATKIRTKVRKKHHHYAPSYSVQLEFGEKKLDGITKRGTK